MHELPYTGINRIRFQGTLSARQGHPQLGYTVTKGPFVCNKIIRPQNNNPMFYIINVMTTSARSLPVPHKPRTLGVLEKSTSHTAP